MTEASEKSASEGARAVVADAQDPARRPDVLFRVRRPEGTEPSVWWPVGGFVVIAAGILLSLNWLPG